jgi:hypothetical protein
MIVLEHLEINVSITSYRIGVDRLTYVVSFGRNVPQEKQKLV